jgi:SAM-dependent methyltransferase
MDAIRKLHNSVKRDFVSKWVRRGELVLDCGCGRGGDWHKWKAIGARVFAIDPDEESLLEAEKRAFEMKFGVFFLGKGDIRQAAFAGPYDIVCYNFSIHYIAESPEIFDSSLKALGVAVKPGGYLIGVTPEKARIEALTGPYGYFKDELGNEIAMIQGGRKLVVRLVDGPFYADGGREEPILDSNDLVMGLSNFGFELILWEPMLDQPNGLISDLYSKFVFKKKS